MPDATPAIERAPEKRTPTHRPGFTVQVCWCGDGLFYVPEDWPRRGRATTCGRAGCHEPEENTP